MRATRTHILTVVLIACTMTSAGTAQLPDSSIRFTLFPHTLLLPPLAANYREPRVGLRKEVGSSRMKVDIGNSLDVAEYRFSPELNLHAGIDFFTYALTTNSQGLRLQIDAVDGYFGGHIVLGTVKNGPQSFLRLRILHISAHFLDGHYDNATHQWKDGREPIPFTRDFGEITFAHSFPMREFIALAYSGVSYATLVRPADVQRFATLHGLEIHNSELLREALGRPVTLFVADDFTLTGVPSYIGTNNLEFGVKFGEWNSTGLKLYASYYSGLDIFSEYYNVRRQNWGLGFAFDFW